MKFFNKTKIFLSLLSSISIMNCFMLNPKCFEIFKQELNGSILSIYHTDGNRVDGQDPSYYDTMRQNFDYENKLCKNVFRISIQDMGSDDKHLVAFTNFKPNMDQAKSIIDEILEKDKLSITKTLNEHIGYLMGENKQYQIIYINDGGEGYCMTIRIDRTKRPPLTDDRLNVIFQDIIITISEQG